MSAKCETMHSDGQVPIYCALLFSSGSGLPKKAHTGPSSREHITQTLPKFWANLERYATRPSGLTADFRVARAIFMLDGRVELPD